MADDLPKAIWEGEFVVMGTKLRCFVLDDGRRIIDADSVAKFFESADFKSDDDSIIEMVKFMRGSGIPQYEMKK